MGNAAEAPYAITQPNVYYDVVPRVLRNLVSFPFNQPFTSTVTLATANAIPQITQGNEIMAFNYTAQSLSSMLEFEVFTAINPTGSMNFWLALFADYSPDALTVAAGSGASWMSVYAKHYCMPVTLSPVRYSLRIAPSANVAIINYFTYGGRTPSRVTVKEWSSLSLNNIAP